MEIGDRVIHKDGSVGHVEEIDEDPDCPIIDVRWLTPNNEPSVCISGCLPENLKRVSDSVVPMPRSDEWWQEAMEFCAGVERAIYKADSES